MFLSYTLYTFILFTIIYSVTFLLLCKKAKISCWVFYYLQEATQKKVEEEKKAAAAAHKLQAFRSEKDTKLSQVPSASSPKKESLFTQIKDSSASALAPPTTASKLLAQSETLADKQPVKTESQSESLMWVDKHKPKNVKQIIGQQGDKSNAKKLLHWLQSWHDNVLVKRLKPAGELKKK